MGCGDTRHVKGGRTGWERLSWAPTSSACRSARRSMKNVGPTALGCCVSGLLRLTENRTLNSRTTTGPAGVSSSVATCACYQLTHDALRCSDSRYTDGPGMSDNFHEICTGMAYAPSALMCCLGWTDSSACLRMHSKPCLPDFIQVGQPHVVGGDAVDQRAKVVDGVGAVAEGLRVKAAVKQALAPLGRCLPCLQYG